MIEIDVISGFLGAGKTTFANLLLNRYAAEKERVVYIVNEFGQTSLDAEIIRHAGFEAVAMPGGCICCTLKGELIQSLKEVIRSFSPTKIVFETSGIFVFNQFEDIFKEEFLKDHCVIRRTIVIYDSINGKTAELRAGSFIENQIKNASVVVVSKLERFSGDVTEIICNLKNVNPDAAVITKPWNGDDLFEEVFKTCEQKNECAYGDGHTHMDSLTLPTGQSMSREAFDSFIRHIVSGEYGCIYRVKGYLRVEEKTFLLNIAMQDVVLQEAFALCGTKVTFIGSKINKARITQDWHAYSACCGMG